MGRFWCEVKVIFVESKEFTKKGKPKLMRVEHRKMYLIDPQAMFDSGDYRIVKKGDKYTISVIPQVAQSIWSNPSGKCEVWYKKAQDFLEIDEEGNTHIVRPFKRTNDKPMDETGLLFWLTSRLGVQQAKIALETLLTQQPDNQKIAA